MEPPTIRESLAEYGRGVVGGLLFALPLLYTMEVWQTGVVASPLRLLAGLGGTFGLLLLYNRHGGLREDASFREIAIDSVEEMALGLVLATLLLWLTGRLGEGDHLAAMVGKVAVCGMMSAVGVSVGTAQLGEENPQKDRETRLGGQLAIALCGAVLVAGNVAPTEEIARIAYSVSPAMTLGLITVALVLSGLVVAVGDFRGGRPWSDSAPVPAPVFAAVATVAVGLVASFVLLLFFGGLAGNAPSVQAAQTVVLGLPASLGASAGRLLLQA